MGASVSLCGIFAGGEKGLQDSAAGAAEFKVNAGPPKHQRMMMESRSGPTET